MIIAKVKTISSRYFCNDVSVKRGTIVGIDKEPIIIDNKSLSSVIGVISGSKCTESRIIGISLHTVISNINGPLLNIPKQIALVGGKIDILTEGIVTINLPYKLQLPRGQPIYANMETDKLDWRKTGKEVGMVEEHQPNGHCSIYVKFHD